MKLIRFQAKEIWDLRSARLDTDPGFWCEYAAALLYHTLRAIGYDSLSPFKRLLAIASELTINQLCQCRPSTMIVSVAAHLPRQSRPSPVSMAR